MNKMTCFAIAFVLLCGRLAACAYDASYFSWLDTLPGVHLLADESTATHVHRVYIADNTSAALRSMRRELVRHGWRLDNEAQVGGDVSGLNAHLGDMRLSAATAGNTFSVSVDLAKPVTTSTTTTTTTTTVVHSQRLTQAVLNQSDETRDYEVAGQVVVNGSANHYTFRGQSRQLVVNGNGNHISGPCEYKQIVLNGSDNVVLWSGSPPQVVDNGSGNRVNSR